MKTIPGFSNYAVNEEGVVFSKKKGDVWRIKNFSIQKKYLRVDLWLNGICKRYAVHRLVALTFIPNPENKPFVCHKDNNSMNPHVSNLYWGTAKENQNDRKKFGTHQGNRKLNLEKVKLIRLMHKNFGWNAKTIARIFAEIWNIRLSTIKVIIKGKYWNLPIYKN